MQRQKLVAGEAGRTAHTLDRLRCLVEALLRQRLRGSMFSRGDCATLGERGVFGEFLVQAGLRRAERIDRGAQRIRPSREAFRLPRCFLEDTGGVAGGFRDRAVNVQNGVEPLLRGVGFARHTRRFGQALQPRDLAVGCGAGAVHRLFDRTEGRLPGLSDLLEGALDLRLPLNAEADGDICCRHRSLPLTFWWHS